MKNEKTNNLFLENVNFDNLMQDELKKVREGGKKPNLLLHSCCAPCSSYVLKRLMDDFNITVFFYNSNLFPDAEYEKRKEEQIRFIGILNEEYKEKEKLNTFSHPIFHQTPIIINAVEFNKQEFYDFVKGYENEFEGSPRCYMCYMLRLNKTAQKAKLENFNYFCTTLTVSPYKNALWINEVGLILSKKYNIPFLHSDFKKNDGYKKSIEYSKEYHLYRQDYCGCEFSFNAKVKEIEKKKQ